MSVASASFREVSIVGTSSSYLDRGRFQRPRPHSIVGPLAYLGAMKILDDPDGKETKQFRRDLDLAYGGYRTSLVMELVNRWGPNLRRTISFCDRLGFSKLSLGKLIEDRAALCKLKQAGPMLPCLSDENRKQFIAKLEAQNIDTVGKLLTKSLADLYSYGLDRIEILAMFHALERLFADKIYDIMWDVPDKIEESDKPFGACIYQVIDECPRHGWE